MMARVYYEQACALAIELGDRSAQGIALANIGWVCGMLGDFPAARLHHEQSLLIAREVDNLYHETYTLLNLSKIAEAQGNAEEAWEYASAAMALSEQAGDRSAEAWAHLYSGRAYVLMSRFEEAKAAFEKALSIRGELGQSTLATEETAGLIQTALQMNDLTLAKTVTEELLSLLSEEATLDATEEPLRVYLECYNALERIGDPRSIQILDTARVLLEDEVSKLGDEPSRRRYIENVPWRRAIYQAWLERKEIP
jgi:tetratricopeptide (TPR) repeat protein